MEGPGWLWSSSHPPQHGYPSSPADHRSLSYIGLYSSDKPLQKGLHEVLDEWRQCPYSRLVKPTLHCPAGTSYHLLLQILSISCWSHWSRGLRSSGCCWKKAAQILGVKLCSEATNTSSADPCSSCRPETEHAVAAGQDTKGYHCVTSLSISWSTSGASTQHKSISFPTRTHSHSKAVGNGIIQVTSSQLCPLTGPVRCHLHGPGQWDRES